MGDFLIKLVRPDLAFSSLRDFIELGGDVLLAIMLATFIMWALIIAVSYTHLTLPTILLV